MRGKVGAAIICGEQRGVDKGFRTCRNRLGCLCPHHGGEAFVGHRAKGGCGIKRVAQFQALYPCNRFFDEGVIQAFVDINPLDPAAALTCVVQRAVHQAINRCVKIGVGAHVARVFAAKFQPQPGEGAGGSFFHRHTATDRACEVHKAEGPRGDQRLGGRMIQHHVLEHISGDARGMKRLGQTFTYKHGLACMFEDHRIACDEGRRKRVDGGEVGIIPRGHDEHDAHGFAGEVAGEGGAIFDDIGGKCRFSNFRHVIRAVIHAAKFTAKAGRATHLVGEFFDQNVFLFH